MPIIVAWSTSCPKQSKNRSSRSLLQILLQASRFQSHGELRKKARTLAHSIPSLNLSVQDLLYCCCSAISQVAGEYDFAPPTLAAASLVSGLHSPPTNEFSSVVCFIVNNTSVLHKASFTMPRSPERTFSFQNDDESSLDLNAIGQGRPEQYYQPPNAAYRDTSPGSYNIRHSREYDVSPPPTPPTHRSPFRDHPPLPPPTDSANLQKPEAPPTYASYIPPPLRTQGVRNKDLGHSVSNRTASTTTPGADNMGEAAAGGGIAGVALGVANHHQRYSGVEALRGIPQERAYNTTDTPYIPPPPNSRGGQQDPFASPAPSMRTTDPFDDANGRGSVTPSPGRLTPNFSRSDQSIPLQQYHSDEDARRGRSSYSDNPYNRLSTAWDPRINRGEIDPNEIEDDGDDGMMEPGSQRRNVLGMRTNSSSGAGGVAAPGTAAGGIMGALGGLVGKSNNRSRDPSGNYGPVGGQGFDGREAEKSEWLNKQTSGRKRMGWIFGAIIALVVVGAAVGGAIGGIKASKSHGSGSSSGSAGQTAAEDDGKGDLNKNSPEILALMNNPDLHKVFPGMDYTPYNAQYPACLSNMPSQNNVTRDMAVLSQLTSAVRLYGTDCNQTEMVLHAINALALKDMKVWLGVWLGNNQTTNDRGLSAMNQLLAKYGASPFAGVIVGNEVLYREDMTETELGKVLSDVRTNLTNMKIDLPLATSDLGDSWTAGLAADVDIVMSNVHPFFAGATAESAAGWTWDFWQGHDVILTTGTSKKNIIAETGWPSAGGNDCGAVNCTSKTQGSIAGVDEMNTFMGDFVCQSLTNGTEFFWYVMLALACSCFYYVEPKLVHHSDANYPANITTIGSKRSTNPGKSSSTRVMKIGKISGAS